MTDHEDESSGFKNKLLGHAKKDMGLRNRGKICFWSNDATDMLIDLWSEETIQFALESSETSIETREVYSTIQVSNIFHLVLFDNSWLSI